MNILSYLLWLIFIILIGCVFIVGTSTVSVDNSVKRPVLEQEDQLKEIDWDEWVD